MWRLKSSLPLYVLPFCRREYKRRDYQTPRSVPCSCLLRPAQIVFLQPHPRANKVEYITILPKPNQSKHHFLPTLSNPRNLNITLFYNQPLFCKCRIEINKKNKFKPKEKPDHIQTSCYTLISIFLQHSEQLTPSFLAFS